jgi:hypothetical protein
MAKKIENKYFLRNKSNGTYTDVTSLFNGVNILACSGLDSKGKSLNVYAEQWITGGTDFMVASEDGRIVRENVDIVVTFIVGDRYASAQSDVITGHGTAYCQTEVADNVFLSDAVCILPQGNTIVTNRSVTFYKYQNGSRVSLGTGTFYTAASNTTIYIALSEAGHVSWTTYSPYANDFGAQEVYDSFVDYMTDTDVWLKSMYVEKQVHCVSLDGFEPKTIKLHRGDNTYILGEIKLKCLEKPMKIT